MADDFPREKTPVESRSAGRVIDMLDVFFRVRRPLTLTELSRMLNLPKSSTHTILQAMRRRGYVVWGPDTKAYSIGIRVVAMAQASPTILGAIRDRSRPYLEKLSEDLHETALLGVFESMTLIYVDKVENSDAVRYTAPLGEQRPLHCTSMGKLYLAKRSDEEVRRILEYQEPIRSTDLTLTNIDDILADLTKVRKKGYGWNIGESIPGLSAYSAPIVSQEHILLGGISIVGASQRIKDKKSAIVTAVVEATRRLSSDLSAID